MTSLLKAIGFGKQDFVGDKARWELDEMLLFDLPCFADVSLHATLQKNPIEFIARHARHYTSWKNQNPLRFASGQGTVERSSRMVVKKKRENMRLVSLCNRSQFSDSLRNSRWLRLTMKSGISPACTHQETSSNIDPLSMSQSVDVGRTSWVIYQAIK